MESLPLFQKLITLDFLHYTYIQSKSDNYIGKKLSLCIIKQSLWTQLILSLLILLLTA
jgi:hypothetical protein